MEEIIDHLHQLLLTVNQIIDGIKPIDFQGAINWGDLHCAHAYFGVDENAKPHYLVVIEEAAPGEYDFCRHIAQELAARGWPDIEISTEW